MQGPHAVQWVGMPYMSHWLNSWMYFRNLSMKTLNFCCPGDSKQVVKRKVGRVGSSEGNCVCCPLYSFGHYWWALKLPEVLCLRKKDVKFAFLSSFVRLTCDLYLTLSCNRVPNKKMLEHSQSVSIKAVISSEHPDCALNQRMLFKWQQWKRFVKILCCSRWICVEE